ncbi:hypothetical protein L195_g029431 [Trifolium pratense]|uniref:Uncharacterized protein n=1 Tax=Trifolium pratense TaxID=57577 RepID=A0A2K3L4T7_TRIPR|nr:hypothetical protein L195_g029431 [Trifolium pratense]
MASFSSRRLTRLQVVKQKLKSFQTIIYPRKDNINICPKFKAFWIKELQKQNQWYGWIDGANGKSCGVKLCVDDDDCYMTRGGYVASVFGLSEPTQVVLDYQGIENRFKMTIIKDENFVSVSGDDLFEKQISESDNDSTNSSFVESVGYPSDLSDSSNIVMREFVNDRLYGWKLTVSKSYADKRKLQVLHFPPATAKYVLRGQYHVFIETLHNLNGVKWLIIFGREMSCDFNLIILRMFCKLKLFVVRIYKSADDAVSSFIDGGSCQLAV